MSTTTPSAAARPPVGTIFLIAVGILPYGVMMSGISGLHDFDGISRGLAGFYALVSLVILWVLLAAMLFVAAMRGGIPGWAALTWYGLLPASAAAAVLAIVVLSGDDAPWTIAAPAALPPLIAGYAMSASLRRLRTVLRPNPTSAAALLAVALLSLVPVAGLAVRDSRREAQQKVVPFIDDAQRRAQERAERTARFEQLTASSPLDEYLQYLRVGDELRDRALAAVHQLPARQEQAESMLRKDFGLDIVRNLPVLDLQPTPSLCQAANDYLARRAADDLPKGADPTFATMDEELEALMPGLRWLVGHGCTAGEALAAIKATALAYPESSYLNNRPLAAHRQVYLDDLAALQRLGAH